MIVYYLAAICPSGKFDLLYNGGVICPAYKFNKVFAEGFARVDSVEARCMIPYAFLKKKPGIWTRETENEVDYIPVNINAEQASYLKYMKAVLCEIKAEKEHDDVLLVCDALSMNYSVICLLAKRLYGITNAAIITDLPQYVGDSQKRSIKDKFLDHIGIWLMRSYDSYIFLTEYMDKYINKKHKPYTIVEGVCEKCEETSSEKYKMKVCIYAGSLHKEYGIDRLIDAFIMANVENSELHIYGDGDYRLEIEKICAKYKNVIYYGVVPNSVIVQEEQKATLLINPRPTSGDYTKYSFPSKTLEYMASGTPVLMTRLPGLPQEYYPYLYLFEDETVKGFTETLKKVLNLSGSELVDMGQKAKKFVMKNKNGKVQAERALKELYKGVEQ